MFLFFTFWACSLMASWVTTFLGCSLATIYCLPQHIAYHIGGEAKPSVVHHVVPERACKNMAYPGPSSCLIHRSAWNRNSANFAFWGFSEVRQERSGPGTLSGRSRGDGAGGLRFATAAPPLRPRRTWPRLPRAVSELRKLQPEDLVRRRSLVFAPVEVRQQMELGAREEQVSVAAHRDGVGPLEVGRPGDELDPAVGTQHLDRVPFERCQVEVPLCVEL